MSCLIATKGWHQTTACEVMSPLLPLIAALGLSYFSSWEGKLGATLKPNEGNAQRNLNQ
jgi:hypothetical protein